MDARTCFARSARFPLLLFGTILLPLSVGAQPALSVDPMSVSAQAIESINNAPSQTVRVSNGGNEALGWSVVLQEAPAGPPTAGWLTVSPMSGTDNRALALTFQAQPAGQYQTKFQVLPATGSSDPVTVTVNLTVNGGTLPSPPPSGVGPQSTIMCPPGAVDILPGQYIQAFVNLYPETTTFCLRAGVHSLTSSITPKTGNTFIGEYGAVLDGAGWTTTDDTQAAFRAYNEDIDYVTILNLVIRNMPHWGIHAFYRMADHWTIEYNEIASNKWGLLFGADFTIKNNYIHHNLGSNPSSLNPGERGGGYVGQQANNTTLESNEIAYNGREQKVGDGSANVTFRNNFIHHNVGDGIWYDFNDTAALIEGNQVEDNGRTGIAFEASNGATIQNNTLRRNAADAVLISMSQNAQIYSNSLEANVGGIQYFLNCNSFSEGYDLQNNATYDNTVVIGTQSNAYANGFSYTFSSCTPGQAAPYLNGLKNLTFSHNTYRVPSLSNTKYFIWPSYTDWNQWQALGQDVGGSISQ